MNKMTDAARELGVTHVIGIVPGVWSRWLRRLDLDAVPVGPKFSIDGTSSQAALFNVAKRAN
jgi:N-acyl-L-homoserine lactone synthetase